MGNTNAATGKARAYSLDQPATIGRDHSPRLDDMKPFDFPANKKKLICYSNSVDYQSDENSDEYKV